MITRVFWALYPNTSEVVKLTLLEIDEPPKVPRPVHTAADDAPPSGGE